MDVRVIDATGVRRHRVDELRELLTRDDGFVWVDIPTCDEAAVRVLTEVFGCHPLAVRDCVQRNRVPRVRLYEKHIFLILHGPERGPAGHVHYIELDQFIGSRYLVTVHGPVNPAVDDTVMHRETGAVLARIESNRLSPGSPYELSYAIVSASTRHLEGFVEELTREAWVLEQRVTGGHMGDPQAFLEELFSARHGLLAVRTMAALAHVAYARILAIGRLKRADDQLSMTDIADQFARIQNLADGEREYLQGVIDFYRARAETKMTIAAERLAVIAVVTLPITAVSSVYGMNIIVNDHTLLAQLVVVLAVMAAMSVALLTWAKRQGWW
jgi:Mg2+ and Co2+ transporter CorA